MMRTHLLSLAVALWSVPSFAISEDELRAALDRRFRDDRTGACVAAAVIEQGTTATTYVCADPKTARPYDEHTAFEIGSCSKPMTAALLAELIARGEVALDDPIAKLLPPGTSVPSFNGREITIRDIVTHTSGLPSFPWWGMVGMNNPYAALTERDLLDALAEAKLTRAPGSQWEYSNFAIMVLSYALARRSGKDFETLLRERLLAPLGMNDTYIAKRPPHVRLAQGHLSNVAPMTPWDFPVDMAGVGGVRATLPDMVRFLEGLLGTRESAITPALARSQQKVATANGQTMGMGWFIWSRANGSTIVWHSGNTGGYSSMVAFDRAAKRAVVLLSDTQLSSAGGFGMIWAHLLDPTVPPGAPRIVATPDSKLVDALAGRYRLPTGLGLDLRRKGSVLTIQADGQLEFQMGYDSGGDFYPFLFDAVLRPQRKADGSYTFIWLQNGTVLQAERLGTPGPVAIKWTPTEAQLKDYDGNYLAPGFALRVFSAGAKLFIDAANHGVLEVAAVENDTFVAEAIGAEIGFERDATGKVIALTLKQHGQVLRGQRH